MAKINYTRPPLYSYQTKILDSKARFTVCQAATKVGKTASHIVWLFEEALKCKAGQSVWWVAPTVGQARIAFDRMKLQISDKRLFTANETNRTITLVTGGRLEFKTAEKPDNLYGDDVYAAVFDEFTRAREAAWSALRSTLTSTGGKCKFIGNVKGKKNWGYKLAMRAQGDDSIYNGGKYEAFRITAYDAADAGMMTKDGRPFREEIEDAKRDLPELVFKELYEAEATEDGSNPFGQTHIDRCTYPMSTNAPVCFGIDLAKKRDWTVITGLDMFGAMCYFDRFQKDWKQTKETIIALPNIPMCIDGTGSGDPIHEDLSKFITEIESVWYTPKQKQQLMEGLAYAIQNREVTFPGPVDMKETDTLLSTDPANCKKELESFEFTYTRTGVIYSAPDGEHDDCVNSLALAKKIHKNAAQQGTYSIW